MKILRKVMLITLMVMVLVLAIFPLTGCAQGGQPADNAVITTDTYNMILQTVVTAVVIPAILFISKAVFDWVRTKTKNFKLDKYLQTAENAVSMAVLEVMQTFVTSLKAQGNWTEDTAKQALRMAKDKAILIIGSAALEALPEVVGDLQTWLTSKIETAVLEYKHYMPELTLKATAEEAQGTSETSETAPSEL